MIELGHGKVGPTELEQLAVGLNSLDKAEELPPELSSSKLNLTDPDQLLAFEHGCKFVHQDFYFGVAHELRRLAMHAYANHDDERASILREVSDVYMRSGMEKSKSNIRIDGIKNNP